MKKITTILLFVIFGHIAFSQYFQASFSNVGNKVSLKVKPNATVTTAVTYIEFFIRYNIATTAPFTVQNIVSNTTNFPSLNMLQGAGYNDGTYQYFDFVHNTGTVASKTYTAGTEYEVMSFTLNGAAATADLELVNDFTNGNYYFVINDGGGVQIDASMAGGSLAQFYGPGYMKSGTTDILPLTSVPVPVKFISFDVVKKDNDAIVVSWAVENEDVNTDKYIVEKSSDGTTFKPAETVPALKNGSSSNTYSVTQTLSNFGTTYFKVKQIDKDGKFVYTSIKSVKLDSKAFAVKASPNLIKTTTTLTIDLVKESKVLVSITDANGKEIKSIQLQGFKGTNTKLLNLNELAAGSYMLKVNNGDEIKTLPIVKAN